MPCDHGVQRPPQRRDVYNKGMSFATLVVLGIIGWQRAQKHGTVHPALGACMVALYAILASLELTCPRCVPLSVLAMGVWCIHTFELHLDYNPLRHGYCDPDE